MLNPTSPSAHFGQARLSVNFLWSMGQARKEKQLGGRAAKELAFPATLRIWSFNEGLDGEVEGLSAGAQAWTALSISHPCSARGGGSAALHLSSHLLPLFSVVSEKRAQSQDLLPLESNHKNPSQVGTGYCYYVNGKFTKHKNHKILDV